MANNGRFRGTWHFGWSYSQNDVAIDNGAYYKAKSDRPCCDDPPHMNPEWEWLHDYQRKDHAAKEC